MCVEDRTTPHYQSRVNPLIIYISSYHKNYMEINRLYKSVSFRQHVIYTYYHGVFHSMQLNIRSPLLYFKTSGEFNGVDWYKTKLYYREATHTWVYRIANKKQQNITCVLKIYYLKKQRNIHTKNPVNGFMHEIEIRYLKLFKRMALRHIFPHTVFPIGHTILSHHKIAPIIGNRNIPSGNYMVLLSECADASLYQEIHNGVFDDDTYNLKIIIFQVLYTLHAIQSVLPSFRHNDLHVSNVLIQKFQCHHEPNVMYVDQYDIGEFTAYVDLRGGRRALLWDMYYSSVCKSEGIEDYITPQEWIPKQHCCNQYVDIHKFFDTMEFALNGRSGYEEEYNLINTVVPEKLKCAIYKIDKQTKETMELWQQHLYTPLDVLKLPYFEQLYERPTGPYTLVKQYTITARSK